MTLYDTKVREYALKVQYGTAATKAVVPSAIGGSWEPATFRPPSTWYAGMFYEDQFFADQGYYQLSEVPGSERTAVPNDDDNWEYRDGAMYNKKTWTWKSLATTSNDEYRVTYLILFDSMSAFTPWEIIKLTSLIKVSKGDIVSVGSGNIKVVPDAVFGQS
jgi:hypothetical protein